MKCVGAGLLRSANVLRGREVARDLGGLVRDPSVEGATVVGCRDGDGGDAELTARAKDPDRDLAAVRDQELSDRRAAGHGAIGSQCG
jgi:hypothetical protein